VVVELPNTHTSKRDARVSVQIFEKTISIRRCAYLLVAVVHVEQRVAVHLVVVVRLVVVELLQAQKHSGSERNGLREMERCAKRSKQQKYTSMQVRTTWRSTAGWCTAGRWWRG
jgi:hypothetical protein